MANELKTCPMCNSDNVKCSTRMGNEQIGYADTVTITCGDCGCNISRSGDTSKGGYADNSKCKGDVLNAWNTRPAAPVEGLERYGEDWDEGTGKLMIVKLSCGEYVRFDQAEAIIVAQAEHIATLESSLEAMEKRAQEAEADNAALNARVKELEGDRDSWRRVSERLERDSIRQASEKEALETKLAAARKSFLSIVKQWPDSSAAKTARAALEDRP